MKKFALFVLLISCAKPQPPAVRVSGVLKSILMENKTEATLDLHDLKDEKHLYAIGAVAGLQGEIIVLDSEPLITKVAGDSFSISNDFSDQAALLVYANVDAWTSQSLGLVKSIQDLEVRLGEIANEHKLTEAFPFRILGSVEQLKWHIVNGNGDGSHQGHAASGYQGVLQNTEAELLGFYSRDHQGVFTHRGQYSHVHFRNNEQAGHVDELVLEKESLLFIPKSY